MLEPSLRVCIPGVKVGMQLLRQAPERNFDLFVGRSRADAKHLIQFVHQLHPHARKPMGCLLRRQRQLPDL